VARFAALLRGINVGRAKRIAMADLRDAFESLGYRNVRTLLNSGNVVFDGPAQPVARHAARIRKSVADDLGVDALVVVKTADEVAGAIAENKLAKIATDPKRLLVVFTTDAKSLAALAPIRSVWESIRATPGARADCSTASSARTSCASSRMPGPPGTGPPVEKIGALLGSKGEP